MSYDALQKAAAYCRSVIEKNSQPSFERSAEMAASESALANYALSRLMLSQLQNFALADKFSENSAHIARLRLEKNDSELNAVAKEFFPSLEPAQKPFDCSMSIFDFLKSGEQLLYAQLANGRVHAEKNELLELLENSIKRKIRELPRADPKLVPAIVKDAAEELEESVPKEISQPRVQTGRYSGKFLSLPCVSKAVSGTGEGKRYYGSMAVAIACTKDGLPKEQASAVMEEYVKHCAKTAHEFTFREGLASLDWVYKHASIGFSCKMIRDQGLAGSGNELCFECPLGKKFRQENKK